MLITGLHTVVDIFCTCCSTNLGWKYVSLLSRVSFFLFRRARALAPPAHRRKKNLIPRRDKSTTQEHAFEETQKYKEGKFIVETARVLKQGW